MSSSCLYPQIIDAQNEMFRVSKAMMFFREDSLIPDLFTQIYFLWSHRLASNT
jgi:hypothetical protein